MDGAMSGEAAMQRRPAQVPECRLGRQGEKR